MHEMYRKRLVARHKGKLRAMKNTHICPKCNSQEIMRIEGRIGGYSGGNDIAGTAGLMELQNS